MCTLTWHRSEEALDVFFNRDERRDRAPGRPPAIATRGTTRFVAPRDGDFGGTWLAANEHGLVLCLLNGFPTARPTPPRDTTTRGMIPLACIESSCASGVADRLSSLALDHFRPFVLVALQPDSAGLRAEWDGARLLHRPAPRPGHPIVSSSFATEEVRRHRISVFERLLAASPGEDGIDLHLGYHAGHVPEAGPWSTCMHRDDARTVSFCHVHVGRLTVELTYVPDSPCRGTFDRPACVLERSAQ